MGRILLIVIFSGLSYLGGKAVYKTIRFKSKIFAAITALIFFSISVLLISLNTGAPVLELISENSLMVFFIPVLASSYYGYMNNVRRAISTFKNRPTVVRQDLIKKINDKESDELSAAKTDKKVDTSKNTSDKKGIDSNKTKKGDVKPDKSLLTILEMGEVPIEDTIFKVSVSLSDSIEKEFDEINASNRIFVLWEVSMFFSVLAYSCQPNLTDSDYKEMHNTFGVMAREIGTQPNMNKGTQEKMFTRYFTSVSQRMEDYNGGTNKLFCEKLFQNIAKVAEINSTNFIESGPSFIKTNTFHFTSGVKRLNGQYSHIS